MFSDVESNTVFFPQGAQTILSEKGPNRANVGHPTEAARCVVPESLPMYSLEVPIIDAASVIETSEIIISSLSSCSFSQPFSAGPNSHTGQKKSLRNLSAIAK